MKFGVNILNFGPGANPRILRSWARLTEALGYHFVMISDHVANTPDVQALFPTPFYDPYVVLAWLAAVTEKIELGTTVTILPYRHPLQTARMAANIDQLSGGRFILGVGAGWAKQEFEALGMRFDRRGAIANEYLSVIKKFWTNDTISHDGPSLSFQEVYTGPRPPRSPHPPIWVGGSSEGAMRRAVRYGDAWHPVRFRTDWLKNEGLPQLRKIAAEENLPIPMLCPRIKVRITEMPLDENARVAGQGTLDQIRNDLEALAALEAQYVLFDTYIDKPESTLNPERDWATLALLAEQVVDLKQQTLRPAR
jgi:probable F420-dependent oxidoreductase